MRSINRLSSRAAATIKESGMHADGGGLYLFVDKTGAKRWTFLFRWHGVRKEMGLGGFNSVDLKTARELADAARRLVAQGKSPIEERKAVKIGTRTFGDVADELLNDLTPQWKNDKHQAQWKMHLTVLAAPLRSLPVDKIGTEDVLRTLKPIWTTTPETASRVRGRIERVLDAAKAKNLRDGENPARWKGHLELLLPKRQTLSRGHHEALPFEDLPAFLVRLRAVEGVAARALEFTILTAARSGETLGARWEEVDEAALVWTVPAGRMKAGKEHRVPLTPQAIAVLGTTRQLAQEHTFPGAKRGKPLSIMAMSMVLRRLGMDCTVHGFRSTFRDWAGEKTDFPREIAEHALAHQVGTEVERAYRRGDALEKRRKLMLAWDAYCATPPPGAGRPTDPPSE